MMILAHVRDVVESVDDDQAERDEEDDPGRDHVGRDQERHPGEALNLRGKLLLTLYGQVKLVRSFS